MGTSEWCLNFFPYFLKPHKWVFIKLAWYLNIFSDLLSILFTVYVTSNAQNNLDNPQFSLQILFPWPNIYIKLDYYDLKIIQHEDTFTERNSPYYFSHSVVPWLIYTGNELLATS